MTIGVCALYSLIDNCFVRENPVPQRFAWTERLIGLLTNIQAPETDPGPTWAIEISLGEGSKARSITLNLEPLLTASDFELSKHEPLSFARANINRPPVAPPTSLPELESDWLWLFRETLYATDRTPKLSELPEVILRIKALYFQRADTFRRLREQVANFEAVEANLAKSPGRTRIPDDVKLLVWTRDGGACVQCGSRTELQFDHIIAYARGGSDDPANLQILCRPCNLSKSDRLV